MVAAALISIFLAEKHGIISPWVLAVYSGLSVVAVLWQALAAVCTERHILELIGDHIVRTNAAEAASETPRGQNVLSTDVRVCPS